MAIGDGWVDGSWVDAGWVDGAWAGGGGGGGGSSDEDGPPWKRGGRFHRGFHIIAFFLLLSL